MRKLLLLLVLICIIQTTAKPQSCLSEGIRFYTQEEIDNFSANYPNCTKIEGTVSFDGEDIINVNGLKNITAIEIGRK